MGRQDCYRGFRVSISKRLHYESTIRSAGFVTNRLVNETGMAPDRLAEVIGGYFADLAPALDDEPDLVDCDLRIETPPPRHARRVVVTFQEGSYRPLVDHPQHDPQPDRSAGLDDRLAWIARHRPPPRKPPHDGPCRWHDVPARPGWFRCCCSLCNRLYGYGRVG